MENCSFSRARINDLQHSYDWLMSVDETPARLEQDLSAHQGVIASCSLCPVHLMLDRIMFSEVRGQKRAVEVLGMKVNAWSLSYASWEQEYILPYQMVHPWDCVWEREGFWWVTGLVDSRHSGQRACLYVIVHAYGSLCAQPRVYWWSGRQFGWVP